MKTCLGDYDAETELDIDVLNMTWQGLTRSLHLLTEAGCTLTDVKHEADERREAIERIHQPWQDQKLAAPTGEVLDAHLCSRGVLQFCG
jgi:hypothetical protein